MPTVTSTEIIADVLEAIRVRHPMLMAFSHEFTSQPLKKGQSAIAHISRMPSVNDVDPVKGYGHADNVQDAKGLYDDVPITIDQHKEVSLSIAYINSISDNKQLYREAIDNAALALGRAIILHVLGLGVAANFSQSTAVDAVNYDRDVLGTVRKSMNTNGASPFNRIGIVNSDAFEALDADPRIANRDYYGQQTGGSALGMLRNVAGFGTIWEYPELPANGENLNGLFLSPEAIAVKTGIPDDIVAIANDLGIPNIANFETVTDPDSGLTLLAIKWMTSGTFDLKVTLTLLWGAVAGRQGAGNDAGSLTDYSGFRTVEAP